VFLLIGVSLSFKTIFSMFLFLQTDYLKQKEIRTVFSGAFFFSFEIFILLIPWYSILVSIKRKIYIHWTNTGIGKSDLEKCLKSEKLNEEFKKFATKEWSVENVYFMEDLNHLKQSNSQKEIKRKSRDLIETYILEDSPLEINISRNVRKEIIHSIQNSEFQTDLFQKVENEVFLNLQDTFDRFKMTSKYDKIIKKSNRASVVDSSQGKKKETSSKSNSLPPMLNIIEVVEINSNNEDLLKNRKRSRSTMNESEKFAFNEFLKTISLEVMNQLDQDDDTPVQSEHLDILVG
jgi:hypothetical protein